ncbi:MAG TPA: hypothetical protein VF017_12660 [Thermoanaerobaculia bacterium]|nr:hypothetical protein [Thermoanaerobaculia bacterium]
MLRRRFARETLAGLAALALLTLPTLAHEGHSHTAMGTIEAIAADRLDLKGPDGKVTSYVLTPETHFEREGRNEGRENVRIGERAVVHFQTKDGKSTAQHVQLGAAKAPSAGGPR